MPLHCSILAGEGGPSRAPAGKCRQYGRSPTCARPSRSLRRVPRRHATGPLRRQGAGKPVAGVAPDDRAQHPAAREPTGVNRDRRCGRPSQTGERPRSRSRGLGPPWAGYSRRVRGAIRAIGLLSLPAGLSPGAARRPGGTTAPARWRGRDCRGRWRGWLPRTVRSRDAAREPTGMYSRRVRGAIRAIGLWPVRAGIAPEGSHGTLTAGASRVPDRPEAPSNGVARTRSRSAPLRSPRGSTGRRSSPASCSPRRPRSSSSCPAGSCPSASSAGGRRPTPA